MVHVPISVDTYHAAVAEAAVAAGADVVNDVSAGAMDAEMLPTVARLGAFRFWGLVWGLGGGLWWLGRDRPSKSRPPTCFPPMHLHMPTRQPQPKNPNPRRPRRPHAHARHAPDHV
jgi:hypothetical protein